VRIAFIARTFAASRHVDFRAGYFGDTRAMLFPIFNQI
jgi:hypothetical protein